MTETSAAPINLKLIALVVFASSLFMRSTDPIIPQIAYGLKIEPTTAALLTTVFSLPYALTQPVIGALADMFNKATLILLCLFVCSLAALICSFASSFEMLMAGRMLGGVASGGTVPIVFALVGDRVPFARRQVAMGQVLFAIMTGNLLGATLGGVVGDFFGWRAVFMTTGTFGLIVFALALPGFRKLDEARGHFDLSTIGPNYRAIFSNPLWKYCFGAVFLEAMFMYGVFPHMAIMLHAAGETRASIAGIVIAGFGIGGALYGVFVARLLAWFGESMLMRLGGIGMGACLLVIATQAPWPVEFGNFLVLGLSFYLLHAVIQIYASELAPGARGTCMALHSFFFFLGQALGPIVYGIALSHDAMVPMLILGAIVLSSVGWIVSLKLRRPATAAI
jgi:predicted MFS family arabinose efflux permease